MPKASELLARASHFRDLAHRARQSAHELAATFSNTARRECIIADLEAQALAMEKQAATLGQRNGNPGVSNPGVVVSH